MNTSIALFPFNAVMRIHCTLNEESEAPVYTIVIWTTRMIQNIVMCGLSTSMSKRPQVPPSFRVGNVFSYRKSCGDYMKRLSNGRYLKERQLGPYMEHYHSRRLSPDT